MLYDNLSELNWGNYGGFPAGGLPSYYYDPYQVANFGVPLSLNQYTQPLPYTPSSNIPYTTPELQSDIQTRFLKFEYDNSLNSTTYLALRYYNWERLETDMQEYELGPFQQGTSLWQANGGSTTGFSGEITHQFGDKLTVTLQGQYNVQHPVWNEEFTPVYALFGPLGGDFTPPSAPCAGIPAGAGYVSCAYGAGVVPAPILYINENNSFFQNYGFGLRFQYAVSDKLHADFGVRYEGQNQHWNNPYNPNDVINPFDVPTADLGRERHQSEGADAAHRTQLSVRSQRLAACVIRPVGRVPELAERRYSARHLREPGRIGRASAGSRRRDAHRGGRTGGKPVRYLAQRRRGNVPVPKLLATVLLVARS